MIAGAIRTELLSWILCPRIVHRLPGRLRLSVPALKHIDPAYRGWTTVWRDVLGGRPEIRSVEMNLTTGTVLIHYSPEQLTEAELLDFLRAVNRIVLRDWDRLAATPPERLPEAVQQMVATIGSGIRHRLVLDDKTDVSSDVPA